MVPLHLHGACACLWMPPLSAFMVLFLRLRGAVCTLTVPIILGNINLRPFSSQIDGSLAPVIPAPFLRLFRCLCAPSGATSAFMVLFCAFVVPLHLHGAHYIWQHEAICHLSAPSWCSSAPSWCPCAFTVPIIFGNISRPSSSQLDGSLAPIIPAPFLRLFRCLCAPSGATSQRLHGALLRLRGALCTFTVPFTFGNMRPSSRQFDGSLACYTCAFPAPFWCLCAPSGATFQRLHGALFAPSWCPMRLHGAHYIWQHFEAIFEPVRRLPCARVIPAPFLRLLGACARLRVPPLSAFMVLFCAFVVPLHLHGAQIKTTLGGGLNFCGGFLRLACFPRPLFLPLGSLPLLSFIFNFELIFRLPPNLMPPRGLFYEFFRPKYAPAFFGCGLSCPLPAGIDVLTCSFPPSTNNPNSCKGLGSP
jgi:hypothetical protein